MQRCITDLVERFAKIEIHTSAPLVPFRESIAPFPAISREEEAEQNVGTTPLEIGRVVVKASGNQCTLQIRAVPLPPRVRKFLLDAEDELSTIDVSSAEDDRKSFISRLKSEFSSAADDSEQSDLKLDWLDLAESILAFGPKRVGSNLLVNKVTESSWLSLAGNGGEMDAFCPTIVSAFQQATQNGPLCSEPLSGVAFILESFELDPEGVDTTILSGQLISLVREGLKKAFLKWQSRLMLAMYSCQLQAPTDILGKVYAVLNRRRGNILSEDMTEGTHFFTIQALMPVIESFGFADGG